MLAGGGVDDGLVGYGGAAGAAVPHSGALAATILGLVMARGFGALIPGGGGRGRC